MVPEGAALVSGLHHKMFVHPGTPIVAMCYDNTNLLPFRFGIAMAVNSRVHAPCRRTGRQTEDFGRLDRRQAHIVELRLFGRLTVEKTAEVMGASARAVKRDEWQTAKAWLDRELAAGKPIDS